MPEPPQLQKECLARHCLACEAFFILSDMLTLSEEQALFFRARRSHLAGPGAANVKSAARDILGAQSQQLPPSLLALSLRTKGRPDAEAIRKALFGTRRTLVRTWGQRDTIHLYDPADWISVVRLRAQWEMGARRGGMPPEKLVDKAHRILEKAGEPLLRRDLFDILPEKYIAEAEAMIGKRDAAIRFATGRLFWRLNLRGDACVAEKRGAEQTYAARSLWFPKLAWPAKLTPHEAAVGLTRRYLALHGPATTKDVAHYLGTLVGAAREWIAELRERNELIEIECGTRKGLLALKKDSKVLGEKVPSRAADWPLRLLPLWDTMLMSHADKSWTLPDSSEEKLVWRKAAMVAASVIARGRIVATWTHKEKRGELEVEVTPLSQWRKAKHEASVKREATAVAAHLGLGKARVTVLDE